MLDVVVIGGGITGLAAAYELSLRGARFELLEASQRLGGLIHTEHVEGYTIEAGPDSLLVQKPAAVELCEELGLGPDLISTTRPRTAYVLKNGRLHALPSPSVLGIPITWIGIARYDLLSWAARVRLALEPLVPPAARGGQDESIASFFGRRFGQASVRLIAEPLLGGIHAGNIELLSIRSLFPRLVETEERDGSILRSLRRAGPASVGWAGEGLFRSLSTGLGTLVSAIEQRLPSRSIRRGAKVGSLQRDGGGWRLSWSGGSTCTRAVIVATPAYVAARLLEHIDAEAGRLCAEVPYVSTAAVALAWPRSAVRHSLAGSGFVVARRHSNLRINACTWVSSKWKGRAPPDGVLLRAFMGGACDPHAAALPEDDLVEIVRRDVSGVLGIRDPPDLARVYRWRDAGAQHNIGQLARVARIEERLSALPGLLVAGSGFGSIGIPDCVADGRAAAAAAAHYITMGR